MGVQYSGLRLRHIKDETGVIANTVTAAPESMYAQHPQTLQGPHPSQLVLAIFWGNNECNQVLSLMK